MLGCLATCEDKKVGGGGGMGGEGLWAEGAGGHANYVHDPWCMFKMAY
jgi:hypothetical protein